MHHYMIRVDGVLSAEALQNFASLEATPGSIQTVLHGDLPDQSALTGIIDYLDTLGVEIVEVVKVPSSAVGDRQTSVGGQE